MLFVALSLVIWTSALNQATADFQQSGLYRAQKQKVFFGNFEQIKGHKLLACEAQMYFRSSLLSLASQATNCWQRQFSLLWLRTYLIAY